jgi:hypothetical protein
MKTTRMLILSLAAGFAAHADFSYTSTQKNSQGMMGGAAAAPQVTKYYFKGSRMMSASGDTAHIMDFGAQTMTTINKAAKTYSVMKMGDMMPAGANISPQIDIKETGQKKTINGFNCSQVMMTMSMDSPMPGPPGMTMQVETEMWISADVPGWQNIRTFYEKNGNSFAAMGGGNAGMQKAMAEMEKKMASMNGIAVQRITRVKSGGGGANAAQMAQANAGMAQARARLEAMIQQGGPQADAARQALARMPGGGGGGAGAPLFEITAESSDFSSADVPDSVFAIPAGFTEAAPPSRPGR